MHAKFHIGGATGLGVTRTQGGVVAPQPPVDQSVLAD